MPCNDSRAQKEEFSSLLTGTQPMKSFGHFTVALPTSFSSLESVLLPLLCGDLHMASQGLQLYTNPKYSSLMGNNWKLFVSGQYSQNNSLLIQAMVMMMIQVAKSCPILVTQWTVVDC